MMVHIDLKMKSLPTPLIFEVYSSEYNQRDICNILIHFFTSEIHTHVLILIVPCG